MIMKTKFNSESDYVDFLREQFDMFEILSENCVNVSIINIQDKTTSLIQTKLLKNKHNENYYYNVPYVSICKSFIEKYIPKEEQTYMSSQIDLNHILENLSLDHEYSFQFLSDINGHNNLYVMRYLLSKDKSHILVIFKDLDTFTAEQSSMYKVNAEQLRKERNFLEVLCRDYTSVYYFDLQANTLEILKMDTNANAANLVGEQLRKKFDYPSQMKIYCEKFVNEKQRKEFLSVMNHDSIQDKLSKASRFAYRYTSKPNKDGHQYFEAQVLRLNKDQFDQTAILGFKQIDDIIKLEKEQRQHKIDKIDAENRAIQSDNDRKAAEAANESKSRFLSSISHDIRTPVNGIEGLLRIMDTYPEDLKKQSECRDKMWIALDYLKSLVTNVLDMNRLENNSVVLKEQSFNLIDLLMSLSSMTDLQASQQGLHTVVDWKPGYIQHRYLIGSSEGLSRILMNLCNNAIKYNKPNGTVYCRCMEKEVKDDVAWFEFINADTGIGMDSEFIKHAFDPYTQKSNDSLNSIHGIGLGLSIVKRTVELMGGTIKLESKLNEGTRYTILLPFKIDSKPPKKEISYAHVSLKDVKVLLVEDNHLNTEIAKFYLEQENMNVTCASNGKEALDIFEKSETNDFDIILMDVVMPVMDGLTATKKIRTLKRMDAKSIPIIAMSANAFEQDIQESIDAGMNDYIVKPLNGEIISNTIKKYLANKITK